MNIRNNRINQGRFWELPLLLLAAGAVLLLMLMALPYVAPIVLGIILSAMMEPIVRILGKPRKGFYIPRTPATLICLILFLAVVGTALFYVISGLIGQVVALANSFPTLWPDLLDRVRNSVQSLFAGMGMQPERFWSTFDYLSGQLGILLEGLVSSAGKTVLNYAMNLPKALVFFFLTILSAFFLTKDKPRYKAFFRNSLPLRVTRVSKRLYSTTLKSLLGYVKAQGILMVISFVMFLLSFHVMSFSYAILLAAIIAVMDALPAIGAGVFLIPWGLIAALTGSYPTAVGLGIIYLLQTLMRQALEPRIVGQQIGINPIVTMLSMYVGLKLFGIFGLVYAPFFVIMLKSVAAIYLDGQTYREKVDGITPHDGF
jgi:sporulation integral membrane protein YtvI